jgi:hypothetical protein
MEQDLFLKKYSIVLGVVALLLVLLLFVTIGGKQSVPVSTPVSTVKYDRIVHQAETNFEATAKVQVLEQNSTKAKVLVEKKN